MLRNIGRRLSHLEASPPLPLTAARFTERAGRHARRTGRSVESALATMVPDLSDEELDSLQVELEQMVFGSDTDARDAARRQTLAAAGYPDLDKREIEETRNQDDDEIW